MEILKKLDLRGVIISAVSKGYDFKAVKYLEGVVEIGT
jgi:hypothetical protein